ncbi:unnamed protein product [Cyprideis torosa]|uniref:4-(cytidine-5'-diphospho)-2-C-methyl-D-erythritol kinase n=1 Tax=Cyprideis torosa TaxID=163714 RepID=A0A7R8WUT6_9CRUS|nr:unnamed protein product [Cyprideis torosa]CAG0905969.1 unnamed protein product [Cyprideis torosa]
MVLWWKEHVPALRKSDRGTGGPMEKDNLILKAPAKVNLVLRVLGQRADGYHDLETWMQKLSLHDTISLRFLTRSGIRLTCSDPSLPVDSKNLLWKAAATFLARSRVLEGRGVEMHLEKVIPVAAGLGGGSSDAGTLLAGLNVFTGNELPEAELLSLASSLGADVPFFAVSATSVLATGIGERMRSVKPLSGYTFLLVNPGFEVSTAKIFANFALTTGKKNSKVVGLLDLSPEKLHPAGLENDLESVTVDLYPVVAEIKKDLLQLGAEGALMSGSGPTVFGLYRNTSSRCRDISLTRAEVRKFSDGEVFVEVKENVRGADVFVVQPTCSPVNDHLMELVLMVDALRRASARRITAVLPYYGYARQDRKVAPRVPISAKVVAEMLMAVGVRRVLSMDLHAGQIQGFFNIPVDHLYAAPVLLRYISGRFENPIMVSPDAGGVERTRAFAKRLNCGLAIIDKRRDRPNESEAMHVIGDVKGKTAILLDDMVDTAGTLCNGAETLLSNGAKEVHACCTHPVLSGPAVERVEKSVIQSLVVTNSIPLRNDAKNCGKIKVLSVSQLLAEAIHRIHNEDSVSSLFV